MKIIGETESGFITEMSIQEVSNLTGYSSSYSSGFKKPKIGDTMSITYLYERVTTIERLLNSGLNEAIDSLNIKVKALNVAKNLFKDIVIIDKKESI